MVKGQRGGGTDHQLLWEELPYLKVEPTGKPVSIYKRADVQQNLPVEERNYYAHFPIRGTRGKRQSLYVSSRREAEEQAQELAWKLRGDLRDGVTPVKTTVKQVVERYLKHKASRIRDEWAGKYEDAGKHTITKARFELLRGKLENYLVPFLGGNTDAKTIPKSKWDEWEDWRRLNARRGAKPKADTLLNEMGNIKACWSWAMGAGLIPHSPFLPFHGIVLTINDRRRRDTWELDEWNSFKSRLPRWLRLKEKEFFQKDEDYWWDCFVAYQMLFFLANNGMRTGEVVKVKRKDVKFFEKEEEVANNKLGTFKFKRLMCYVQVHKSTKTGAREVVSMGGEFAMRVYEKANHKKKNDFLFQHLDGSAWTTRQFGSKFREIMKFTGEEERLGKKLVPYSLRHFYATTRIYNNTPHDILCRNMGVGDTYLRNHYDHTINRHFIDELTRMRKKTGNKTFLKEGEDFCLMDED